MMSDFLGFIGGLEFVTGEQAFTEAANAQRQGHFGRPASGETVGQSAPTPGVKSRSTGKKIKPSKNRKA
jgi:hypothetical protein